MPAGRSDLADFIYFLAIARRLSFRGAAAELGVGAPALSNAIRGLEGRLGVRLFDRTNRNVALTAAGEQLRLAIEDPFRRIDQAVDDLDAHRDAPLGRVRLNVLDDAAAVVLAPVMASFGERYPGVSIETVAGHRPHDHAFQGADATIGLGEGLPPDAIAIRLGPDVRWVTAAAPAYLDSAGTPTDPEGLLDHRCLAIRMGAGRPDRWRFEGPHGPVDVTVPCRLVSDDSGAVLAAASDGGGVVHAPEPILAGMLDAGSLRRILDDRAGMRPGYHLWHTPARTMPMALALLVNLMHDRSEGSD